ARRAVEKSPKFGFAWARLAELEFSFGRTGAAASALERALSLSPRHAEAVALKGFLSAAQNRIPAAIQSFNEAIAIDGALGNAWLGRGLCKIRQGGGPFLGFAGMENGKSKIDDALRDLETAAVLEPQRALPRSYLGKAFSQSGDDVRAITELTLAQRLDPND